MVGMQTDTTTTEIMEAHLEVKNTTTSNPLLCIFKGNETPTSRGICTDIPKAPQKANLH